MTRLIELPQEVEEIAAAHAQRNGISLEEYLPEIITNALTQRREAEPENRAARIQRFRQWAESNAHDTPHLSDEQISRGAMYTDA